MPVLVLRFAWQGASEVRLHFRRFQLPEGAVAYVYGRHPDGSARDVKGYTGGGPAEATDFWTDSVTGEEIVVEVAWGGEIPAALPFEAAEIGAGYAAADPEPAASGDFRQTSYRGMDLNYEVRDGLAIHESDIVLGSVEELERSAEAGKQAERFGLGITGARYRWPGGRIPYLIEPGMPSVSRITGAIAHWNSALSGVIRLVPRTTESNYLVFARSGSCSSAIGMIGGAQRVNVADWCSTGSVIHEIGHAVGLWHEQSRADRNAHVRILWDRIVSSMLSNFSQAVAVTDDLGTYDFNSIMHYPATAFSINGQPTIETIPAGIPIGQRNGLSAGDIAAVRRMYGAASSYTPAPAPTPTHSQAPSTVQVAVSTNPAGQKVAVDGTVYTSPRTFTWTVGSSHTVEALDAPLSNGAQTSWVRWSDGGARRHTVTSSTSLTALLATYAAAYRVTTAAYPAGTGTVAVSPDSASELYASGTALRLTAQPAAGYCFDSWTGLLAGTPSSTTLTVDRSYAIRANFATGAFTLGGSSRFVGAAGGTFDLGVTASGACAWAVQESASWVTILSGASGRGNGVIKYRVGANTTGAPRITYLKVGTTSFVIFQAG